MDKNTPTSPHKRLLILGAKIVFIIVAFALIFYQADVGSIKKYITSIGLFEMALCVVLMGGAQTLSGIRSKFYFDHANMPLSQSFCIKLYFIGMMFNNILPGGIGGDAYRLFYIKKKKFYPARKALIPLISERASGLYILIVTASILACTGSLTSTIPYLVPIAVILALFTAASYHVAARLLLKEPLLVSLKALPFSLAIQSLNFLIIYILAVNLSPEGLSIIEAADYLSVFAIAAIVSILPVSIGGIGIRELIFLYCAPLTAVNAGIGIAVSLLYVGVLLICSTLGIWFWHSMPLKEMPSTQEISR